VNSPVHIVGHLGLAGASGDTVGLGSGRLGAVGLARGGRLGVREVGKRSLAHTAQGFARRLLAARLLVGRGVEGDEEHEVRAENSNTGESGKLLARALARVGHEREVGRGEVSVGGEVDEPCYDEEY
jgi:hypothetical protein